jgi:hypothetical protein
VVGLQEVAQPVLLFRQADRVTLGPARVDPRPRGRVGERVGVRTWPGEIRIWDEREPIPAKIPS